MSTLRDLGCSEMRADACYVGRFASGSELTAPGTVPFGAVFAKETLTEETLSDFLRNVVAGHRLPFRDFLGWLLEPSISTVLPSSRILAWLRSLYYEIVDAQCDKSPGAKYTVAMIKSSLNVHFRLKVYVTQQPRPQETVVVVPLVFPRGDPATPCVMFRQRVERELHVAFGGNLGRMPLMVIRVSGGGAGGSLYRLIDVDCRKGAEHQKIVAEVRDACDLWSGDLVEIPPLGGYRRFYVGVMSHADGGDGDCRYRPNTSRETGAVYGYERKSTTHLVAAVFVDGASMTSMPVHPLSGLAVMRGAIVGLSDARSGFHAEGALPPGVDAHREQLERVCVMIPRITEVLALAHAAHDAPAAPMHAGAQNQSHTEILYLQHQEEAGVRAEGGAV